MIGKEINNSSPPLRLWLISIITVIAIIATGLFLLGDPVQIYLNTGRLKYSETDDSEKKRIICFGGSAVKRAMFFDTKLDSIANMTNLNNYCFNRFVLNGGNITNFYPLFDKILESNPYAVILSSKKLIYHNENRPIYRNRRYYIKEWIGHWFDIDNRFENHDFNQMPNASISDIEIERKQKRTQTPENIMKSKNLIRRFRANYDLTLSEDFNRFLIESRKKGILVICVNLLPSPAVRDALPLNEEHRIEIQQKFADKYGIIFWEFPFELGMEDYLDTKHLIPEIQLNYSKWLMSQVQTLEKVK